MQDCHGNSFHDQFVGRCQKAVTCDFFFQSLSMKVTGSITTFMMTFGYVFVGFYSDKHKTPLQEEPVLCDEAVEQKSSIVVCLFLSAHSAKCQLGSL